MIIGNLRKPFIKIGTANTTATAFPSLVATTTCPYPTSDSPAQRTRVTSELDALDVMVVPFSALAADGTVAMRAVGWSAVTGGSSVLYIPCHIAQWDITIGTATGAANGAVGTAERFADTIAASTAVTGDTATRISSPANNGIGYVVFPRSAFEAVQIEFSGSGCNALVMEF